MRAAISPYFLDLMYPIINGIISLKPNWIVWKFSLYKNTSEKHFLQKQFQSTCHERYKTWEVEWFADFIVYPSEKNFPLNLFFPWSQHSLWDLFFLKYTTTLKWPKNYVKPRIWNIQVSMTWNVNEHVKSRRINTCVCQQLMINWWWKLVKVVQKPLNLGSDVSFYCKDSAPRYHFFLTPFTLRESWTCLTNESTRGKKAGF